MTFNVLGIIPARYGSTRLPGKLLIPILNKTVIQRTFENAQQIKLINQLMIATDDEKIFQHVKDFGAHVVMTSKACLNGTERLAEVLRNNPELQKVDAIVNIQGDEPFLDVNAIDQAIQLLLKDSLASMSTLVTPIRSEEEALAPSIVKCIMDREQNALYFSRTLIPSNHKQQYNPEHTYYRHIGLYVYRPEFLLQYQASPSTPLQLEEDLEQLKVLERGFRIKVAITDHASIGVDVPEDLKKIEQWLSK